LLEAKNQALDQVRDLHRFITAKFQIVWLSVNKHSDN
jgi:hypothetical protein